MTDSSSDRVCPNPKCKLYFENDTLHQIKNTVPEQQVTHIDNMKFHCHCCQWELQITDASYEYLKEEAGYTKFNLRGDIDSMCREIARTMLP